MPDEGNYGQFLPEFEAGPSAPDLAPQGAAPGDYGGFLPEFEGPGPEVSRLGAFGRSALAAAPVAAGAALTAKLGGLGAAALAPATGPLAVIAPLAGQFIGGMGGAIATAEAEEAFLKANSPETYALLKAGEQQHPWTALAGRLAGNLPTFAFDPTATVRGLASIPVLLSKTTEPALRQAAQRQAAISATQLGLGAATGVVGPALHGELPTGMGILEAVGQAGLFGQPRSLKVIKVLIPRSVQALEESPGPRPPALPEPERFPPFPERPYITETEGVAVEPNVPPLERPVIRLVDPLEETVVGRELAKETSLKSAAQLAWLDRAKRQTPNEPVVIATELLQAQHKYFTTQEPLTARERNLLFHQPKEPEPLPIIPVTRGAVRQAPEGGKAEFEGTYPPTAEQLGTFQSRTSFPPGRSPQPIVSRTDPFVVPPESLQAEFPLGGSTERGTEAERWADRILSEDPRSQTRMLLLIDPKDPLRIAAYVVKGAALIEKGLNNFSGWAREMAWLYGEAIRPHLDELWKRSQIVFQLQTQREGVRPRAAQEEIQAQEAQDVLTTLKPPAEVGEAPAGQPITEPLTTPPNALQIEQAATLHGNVPEQPIEGQQGVSAQEGAGGIPLGNLQQEQAAQGEVPLTEAAAQARLKGYRDRYFAAQRKAGLAEDRIEVGWDEVKDDFAQLANQPDVAPLAEAGQQALGIRPRPIDYGLKNIGRMITGGARYYSEWMTERLRRLSLNSSTKGVKSAPWIDKFNIIIDRAKRLHGSISREWLNPAKKEAGRLGQASKWLHQLVPVTDVTFISNMHLALENQIPVPEFAQHLVALAQEANLKIGQLLEPVIAGFKAVGAVQRNLTSFGYDVIRQGYGKVWDRWTEGLAKANNVPKDVVRDFFTKWKATLDEAGPDNMAQLEKVNQDFQRQFKRAITHVRVEDFLGGHIEEVVHANLFNYLENAARRAANIRAFREQFPFVTNKAGKQVSSPEFKRAYKEIMAEIPSQHKKDLEGLVRALNGHPTDSYDNMGWFSPSMPIGAAFRIVNQTVNHFAAQMALSGQILVQTGESTPFGATGVFLGAGNQLKGLARYRQTYAELEKAGMVNPVLYDFSFDPNSPIRSAWRIAGNAINKGFGEQLLNELQEASAAATAKVVTEKIRTGALSDWEKGMLPVTFRAIGFTSEQVKLMMSGQGEPFLQQFETKAATWLTSGNKAIAEGSRLGASRLFNSLFRFQSYPMMKANQLRRIFEVIGEAHASGDAQTKLNAYRLLGRFMFGLGAQQMITTAITTLFYQQIFGVKIAAHEAADDPFTFIAESMLSAMGGPLYLLWRGARTDGRLGIGEAATRAFFPYAVITSIMDAVQGRGAYSNLEAQDRFAKFVEQKVPGTRVIRTAFSLVGLGQDNLKLDVAIRGLNRWKLSELGPGHFPEVEPTEFRTAMRTAVGALQKGDRARYMKALARAVKAPNTKASSISRSFLKRKVLVNREGAKLTYQQLQSLRERIGREAVQRLQYYDAMLEAAAQGVILSPKK